MAFKFRRLSAVLLMAAAPLTLAACASSSEAPATVNVGANRAAVYPDITAVVTPDTQQMSDEEAADQAAFFSGAVFSTGSPPFSRNTRNASSNDETGRTFTASPARSVAARRA